MLSLTNTSHKQASTHFLITITSYIHYHLFHITHTPTTLTLSFFFFLFFFILTFSFVFPFHTTLHYFTYTLYSLTAVDIQLIAIYNTFNILNSCIVFWPYLYSTTSWKGILYGPSIYFVVNIDTYNIYGSTTSAFHIDALGIYHRWWPSVRAYPTWCHFHPLWLPVGRTCILETPFWSVGGLGVVLDPWKHLFWRGSGWKLCSPYTANW